MPKRPPDFRADGSPWAFGGVGGPSDEGGLYELREFEKWVMPKIIPIGFPFSPDSYSGWFAIAR